MPSTHKLVNPNELEHLIGNSLSTLEKNRNEFLRQAKWSFNAAIFLTVLGVCIIFTGVTLGFFNKDVSVAIVTAMAGIVSDALAGTVFFFTTEKTNSLAKVTKEILTWNNSLTQMLYINELTDPAKKDEQIIEIVSHLRQSTES